MKSTPVVFLSKQHSPLSRRGVAAALLLSAGLTACAPGARDESHVAVTAEEIIGGFPASSAKLNAIGALGSAGSGGKFTPFCTGTLISPTMVLTAKHCLVGRDPAELAFLIGPNAFAPLRIAAVQGVAVEPTVTGGVIDFGSDVGIVHLTQPIDDIAALPTAALSDDRIGSRMVALGYGVQNTDLTFGTRQSGSMTLRATHGPVFAAIFGSFDAFVQNGATRLFPDLDPKDPAQLAQLQQQFDTTRLIDGIEAWVGAGPGDAQACTGDGGGPLTARVGSQPVVFGVSSWGFGENETCTLDGSAYATLNPVSLDFIDYETKCPLIPRAGTCEGLTIALRCAGSNEGGHRPLRTDCGELSQICGVDASGEVGCVDDPCDGIPESGTCNGQVVTRCSGPGEGDRRVVTTDCAAQSQVCSVETGVAACTAPPNVCSHALCTTGGPLARGCNACVTQICTVDSFCCNSGWDGACVAEVGSVCGQTCFAGTEPTLDPL